MIKPLPRSQSDDPAYASAAELVAAIRAGRLGSRELLDHLVARIERLNPAINAVVTLDLERARARADEADAASARGESWGPLHGLPMTIKDSFETAGLATTSGAPKWADHVPKKDAVAVARLKGAGAVVFGKTNLPLYAGDVQSYNEIHGVTNNPWDPLRGSGGSSGGAAAALAAGLTPLELGSDIGGSIRNPAHFCGVVGHKPSYGLVPMRGHLPGPPGTLSETDIAVAGPLARRVDDLELALGVLAGPDVWATRAWRLELPEPRHAKPGEYRVAAWLDDPACPIDGEAGAVLEAAVAALRESGVAIDEGARPGVGFLDAFRIYQRLLNPVMASGMSDETFERYIKIVAGLPPERDDEEPVLRFPRYAIARHVDWLRANERRTKQRAAWAAFFEDFDILLCPVMPTAAFPHDHEPDWTKRRITVNGQPFSYIEQIAWAGMIGAAYLPSTVVPAGLTAGGLPVGIQVVGPYLEDRTALAFARHLEAVTGGFRRPPGY